MNGPRALNDLSFDDLWSEPQPQDFHACFRRAHTMSIAARQQAGWRRATMLRALAVFCAILAMLAVQAYRGQGTGALALAATVSLTQDPQIEETALAPMPYETPGESFPGSAYYYLSREVEPAPAAGLWGQTIAAITGSIHGEGEDSFDAQDAAPLPNAGTARALAGLNSPLDRSRALTCLTAAIYYEAASEPEDGQRAVAQVVLNRVAHPAFPNTVCGVVYQGSERVTGCQFSFTCDGALARKPSAFFWARAQRIAQAALDGQIYAPVGLATHYHTFAVHPYWAPSLNFLGQIGAHRFYRMQGMAGAQATFRFAHLGVEPLPQPNARSTAPRSQNDADPIAIARAYDAQYRALNQPHGNLATTGLQPAGQPAVYAAPQYAAPAYTSEALRHGGEAAHRAKALPGTDTVRPEYQNSGRWIAQPLS